MKTTIDGAGRVVIPKALRDELGLTGGEEVEVSLRDGHLELEPVSVPMHLVEREGVLMAEPDAPIPPLTVEQVRETLDRVRR